MYTPEELQSHTKTKLHSISIIYRLMKIISPVCSSDFLLWQAVNPNQKKLPQRTRSKYLLRIKS
jgi:hypothetical protein